MHLTYDIEEGIFLLKINNFITCARSHISRHASERVILLVKQHPAQQILCVVFLCNISSIMSTFLLQYVKLYSKTYIKTSFTSALFHLSLRLKFNSQICILTWRLKIVFFVDLITVLVMSHHSDFETCLTYSKHDW